MQKVLLIGPEENKKKLLKKMQSLGVLEIDAYKGELFESYGELVDSNRAEEALGIYKVLKKYETIKDDYVVKPKDKDLSGSKIVDEITELEKRLQHIEETQQILVSKIKLIEPWGSFENEEIFEIEKKTDIHIQFWECSEKEFPLIDFEEYNIVEKIEINHEDQKVYFMTFAESEINIEHCSESKFDDDLEDLEIKLAHNHREQAEIKEEIVSYIPNMDTVFKYYLQELNSINYENALNMSVDALDGKVFAMQGWVLKKDFENFQKENSKYKVEIFQIETEKGEKIPTEMKTKGLAALGEGLVKFYDTPSYKDWDPSTWVFLSFTVFFAMIMGDGGYGLTLFLLLLFLRIKMKKLKTSSKRILAMAMVLCGANALYGLAFGSFYGITSKHSPVIAELLGQITERTGLSFDPYNKNDLNMMMRVSVLIGLGHISLSLFLKSLRDFSSKQFISPFANFAWIAEMWIFYYLYSLTGGDLNKFMAAMMAPPFGFANAICFGIVFLASSGRLHPGKVIAGGLAGLYNGVQFFSDVLSYIRIFALGLSGTLIALTFNDMATGIWQSIPYAGPVLAAVIFVFGHLLNIGLCLMGAVIHGLRLNFLEFYRWSFDGDGRPFKPLKDLLSEES